MVQYLFHVRWSSPLFSRVGILMASLDEMWARFSLTEEEEGVRRFLRMRKRVYTV